MHIKVYIIYFRVESYKANKNHFQVTTTATFWPVSTNGAKLQTKSSLLPYFQPRVRANEKSKREREHLTNLVAYNVHYFKLLRKNKDNNIY